MDDLHDKAGEDYKRERHHKGTSYISIHAGMDRFLYRNSQTLNPLPVPEKTADKPIDRIICKHGSIKNYEGVREQFEINRIWHVTAVTEADAETYATGCIYWYSGDSAQVMEHVDAYRDYHPYLHAPGP